MDGVMYVVVHIRVDNAARQMRMVIFIAFVLYILLSLNGVFNISALTRYDDLVSTLEIPFVSDSIASGYPAI